MNSRSPEEDLLTKLLETWVIRQANDECPTVTEVCRGHEDLIPQLEQRIEQKKTVDSLVEEWEDLVESGCTPKVEDLCREYPDLVEQVRREIEVLRKFDSLFGNVDTTSPTMDEMSEFCGGRYEIEESYASGGFGVLFRARDRELNRAIVVKTMRRAGAGRETQKHFEREANITGQLEHPGVVPVYGFGRDTDGRPYLAMKLVRGETLRASIKRFHQMPATSDQSGERAIEFQKLLRGFVTVCQTVAFAHSRQIIHRDIKPANIMLGKYGEVLVIDWGLAKRTADAPDGDDADEPLVGSGLRFLSQQAVKGTPSYMSPEQASPKQGQVGPASDIFSLGATLFELLTGREPYSGNTSAEILEAVKSNPVPRARDVAPTTPRPLEEICLKAMRKNPAERYADAQELAKDLERYLADEPVSAWTEPLSTRLRRSMKRHRTIATGIAAAMLVALIATSVAAVLISAEQKKLRIANDELERRIEEQRHAGYMTEFLLASAAFENGEGTRANAILDRTEVDLRGIEWVDLKRRIGSIAPIETTKESPFFPVAGMKSLANMTTHIDVSADGTRQATGTFLFRALDKFNTPAWQISVDDLASKRQICRVEGLGWLQELNLSDNGRQLGALVKPVPPGYQPGDAIRKAAQEASEKSRRALAPWLGQETPTGESLNIETGRRERYFDLLQQVQKKPDQGDVAEPVPAGLDHYVWNAKTGEKMAGITPVEFANRFRVRPGASKQLNVESVDNGVYKYKFWRGAKEHEVQIHPPLVVNASAINPAGDLIATFSPDAKVRLWSTTNGREVGMLLAESNDVRLLRFVSDDRLVCAGSQGLAQLLQVPPGPLRISIKNAEIGEVLCTDMLPENGRLFTVSTDGFVRTSFVQTGDEAAKFAYREESNVVPKISVALNADRSRLAVVDPQGLQVFDIASRKSLYRVVDITTPLAWSPDGQSIVAFRELKAPTELPVNAAPPAKSESAPPNGEKPYDPKVGHTDENIPYKSIVDAAKEIDLDEAEARRADEKRRADESGLVVLDATSGAVEHFHKMGLPDFLPRDVVFLPVGTQFAVLTNSGEWIQIWDPKEGVGETKSLKDWGSAERIFFSPVDAKRLITVSDAIAHIWDVPRWRLLSSLEGHSMKITDAIFLPDKTRIATSSADGTVRIWDARSGSQLAVLNDRTRNPIWSVREHDGQIFAGTSGVLVWDFQAK